MKVVIFTNGCLRKAETQGACDNRLNPMSWHASCRERQAELVLPDIAIKAHAKHGCGKLCRAKWSHLWLPLAATCRYLDIGSEQADPACGLSVIPYESYVGRAN
eukprot:5765709-Amphidinium_carterae.1